MNGYNGRSYYDKGLINKRGFNAYKAALEKLETFDKEMFECKTEWVDPLPYVADQEFCNMDRRRLWNNAASDYFMAVGLKEKPLHKLLEDELNTLHPNAASKTVVEVSGHEFKKGFEPCSASNSGKTVYDWLPFWYWCYYTGPRGGKKWKRIRDVAEEGGLELDGDSLMLNGSRITFGVDSYEDACLGFCEEDLDFLDI